MKNTSRLLLVAALIVAETLCAQTPGSGPAPQPGGRRGGPGGPFGPGGPGGPGRFQPLVRVLDADHNGEISAEEIAQAATALRALDVNGDGTVSLEELRPARPPGPPAASAERPAPPARRPGPPAERPGPPPQAPTSPAGEGRPTTGRPHPVFPLMLALDANSDGVLSASEIANAPASLRALDANGDGKLTRDELRPLPPVE